MKRLVVFVVTILFLMSFAAAITSRAVETDLDDLVKLSEGEGNNSGDNNENDSPETDDSSDDNDTLETNRDDSNEDEQESPEIEDESDDDSFSRERIEDRIKSKLENAFCGTSTFAECDVDSDCINEGCSSAVCQGVNEEPIVTTCEYRDCYNAGTYRASCRCIKNKCMWNRITEEQIKAIIASKNRIRAGEGECAEDCTCTGRVTKCRLEDGTREMIITAGNSGNIIIQVKGINGTTNVTLYKHDGKIYAVNKNNETIRIKLLPDQVKEKIRERIKKHLEGENITLNEDGTYEYRAKKRARLFFMIPVDVEVTGEFDAESGKILRVRNSWWAFLAKDEVEDEEIAGASCGTVTTGENDNCCISRGYDFYNSEDNECEFEED